MAIDRIVLTGDILRPWPGNRPGSESRRRIRWFDDLLTPPLAEVTDLPVHRLACEAPLDLETLYGAAGLEPSIESWAQLYAGGLPAPLRDRVVALCRDSVVIGIELPPSMAQALFDAGIPFIDALVDPLRFLSDIPLGWRSTVPEITEALESFRLSGFEVRRRAAHIRAKCRWMPPLEIPDHATLLLDQVPQDAALIDPTRRARVGWGDYLDRLAVLKAEGPIIWRPHPHNPAAGAISEVLGPTTRSTANIYQLLSDDRLDRVAAISSGGVIEARAFGKVGIHFMDRSAGIAVPGWNASVPVVGDWLSPHFWSRVLGPLFETRRDAPRLPPEPNALRKSINCDWGFGWIDQVTAT